MSEEAKKNILIIEDEKPMARALELKLKFSGFDAKVVHNGKDGLKMLENEKFDLVLSDLVMPKVDGFAVLTKLRKNNNKIPIIILSNLSQLEDEKKAKELGALDFFVKSNMPITDIVEYVKKILK